jgi:hypothetical protein
MEPWRMSRLTYSKVDILSYRPILFLPTKICFLAVKTN